MASSDDGGSSSGGGGITVLVKHVYRNVTVELKALPPSTTVGELKRLVQAALAPTGDGAAAAAAAAPARQRLIHLGKVCTSDGATLAAVFALTPAEGLEPGRVFTVHLVISPASAGSPAAPALAPAPAPAPAPLARNSNSSDAAATAAAAAASALRAASPTPNATGAGGASVGAHHMGGPANPAAPAHGAAHHHHHGHGHGPPAPPHAPAVGPATSPLPMLVPSSGAPRMAVAPAEEEDRAGMRERGDGGDTSGSGSGLSSEGLRRRRLQRFGPSAAPPSLPAFSPVSPGREAATAIPSVEARHRAAPGTPRARGGGTTAEEMHAPPQPMAIDPQSAAAAMTAAFAAQQQQQQFGDGYYLQQQFLWQQQQQQMQAAYAYHQQQQWWLWWQQQQQQAAAAGAAPADGLGFGEAAAMGGAAYYYHHQQQQQHSEPPPFPEEAEVEGPTANPPSPRLHGAGAGIRPTPLAQAAAGARAAWALMDWQLAAKMCMMVLLMHPADPQRFALLCALSAAAYLYQTGILALLLGPAFRRPRFGMAGEEEGGQQPAAAAVGAAGAAEGAAQHAAQPQSQPPPQQQQQREAEWKRQLRALVWDGAIPPRRDEGEAGGGGLTVKKLAVDAVVLTASIFLSLFPTWHPHAAPAAQSEAPGQQEQPQQPQQPQPEVPHIPHPVVGAMQG